jgi:hypothetical protein
MELNLDVMMESHGPRWKFGVISELMESYFTNHKIIPFPVFLKVCSLNPLQQKDVEWL